MDCKIILFLSVIGVIRGLEAVERNNNKLKLVVDHDGGADDAMAIFMCILYEKYFDGPHVVALTTTHGNVNESQVFKNSNRFLDITGRHDVAIYRGATQAILVSVPTDGFFGHDGLGDNKDLDEVKHFTKAEKVHAVVGLIELSKKYEGELIVMAIGPLTNIALAQRLDPGFIGRLAQLYVGAGHIHSDFAPMPEFNALMDVEAYRIVADSALSDKVTLVPFSQILASMNVTSDWRVNVLGAIKTRLMQTQNKYERLSLAKKKKWSLLDPAVAAVVLDNNVMGKFKYANNSIIVCGTERGINTNTIESASSEDTNVRLVYSAEEDTYKKLLFDIFSAELID